MNHKYPDPGKKCECKGKGLPRCHGNSPIKEIVKPYLLYHKKAFVSSLNLCFAKIFNKSNSILKEKEDEKNDKS